VRGRGYGVTWHIYASTRFATGCLDASPNTKMNRLAEMSCSRYWIERALEDAKGEVSMAAPSHDNGPVGEC